jgi:hypothetical protein
MTGAMGCDLFWDEDPLPTPMALVAAPAARRTAPTRGYEPSVSAAIAVQSSKGAPKLPPKCLGMRAALARAARRRES